VTLLRGAESKLVHVSFHKPDSPRLEVIGSEHVANPVHLLLVLSRALSGTVREGYRVKHYARLLSSDLCSVSTPTFLTRPLMAVATNIR
jgi:hypothetical protein